MKLSYLAITQLSMFFKKGIMTRSYAMHSFYQSESTTQESRCQSFKKIIVKYCIVIFIEINVVHILQSKMEETRQSDK